MANNQTCAGCGRRTHGHDIYWGTQDHDGYWSLGLPQDALRVPFCEACWDQQPRRPYWHKELR